MGSFSIWHWLIVVIYVTTIFVYFKALARILNRMGYSGWWSLLSIVPIVNLVAVWMLSKAEWPGRDGRGDYRRVLD